MSQHVSHIQLAAIRVVVRSTTFGVCRYAWFVSGSLGESAAMEMRVTPRGKKYTKKSVKVSVESSAMISSIYEELDALKDTVMKF